MILLCYGTRPEWIKLKPIIHEFDINNYPYKILFTGQHEDLLKEQIADFQIEIPETSNNRLNEIVMAMMTKEFSWIFNNGVRPSHVLVQGDTTSAMAVALSAFHHGIKVIHLEAGLRTYDRENPYPEEINRRIISQIADIHFCPTELSMKNLISEKIGGKMYVVGNTAIDNLLPWKEKVNDFSNNVLVTLHRRENHHWMKEWFLAINNIANNYKHITFIFPVHPNPNVQKCKEFINAPNIKLIEPVNHEELLNILVDSRLVITDSGGLQEECSFFNKICLTCRKVTERPEAIGQSTVMVKSPQELSELFDKYINNFHIQYDCPFGDGHSAEKIMKILKNLL